MGLNEGQNYRILFVPNSVYIFKRAFKNKIDFLYFVTKHFFEFKSIQTNDVPKK